MRLLSKNSPELIDSNRARGNNFGGLEILFSSFGSRTASGAIDLQNRAYESHRFGLIQDTIPLTSLA